MRFSMTLFDQEERRLFGAYQLSGGRRCLATPYLIPTLANCGIKVGLYVCSHSLEVFLQRAH